MASPKRAEHKVQMNKVANHCCVYAGIIKKRTREAWQQIQNLPEKGNTGSGHWKVVEMT